VIQTCLQCGAINGAEARTCGCCDAPLLVRPHDTLASRRTAPQSEGNLAIAPDWRAEVSQRLEAYRVRRGRPRENDAQPAFPFTPPLAWSETPREVDTNFSSATPAIKSRRYRPVRVEHLEIDVAQPAFDFAGAERLCDSRSSVPAKSAVVIPVATLSERRRAGLLDAVILILAYSVSLALFSGLGGHLRLSKIDAVVTGATLGLFYAQYVMLFTYFARATPGMMLRGLRIVSSQGGEASAEQLLWRSFGYLISAGTAMLGFLWALWDEGHLSWHDRISQTFITAVPAEAPRAGHNALPRRP
jgi:uncharacterized RDD family membrane protein YckC